MSSIDRKTRHKEALRTGILQAARNIALKEGWQAVTIRKIADEVEYTPPIVYEFFENKEAVFFEVAMDGFTILRNMLEAEVIEDTHKQLCRYAIIHWHFAEQNPELYKLMFSIESIPSVAEERPQEVLSIGELIKNAMKAITPGLEDKEYKELFFQWMCIVHGFITMALIMRHRIEKEPDAWEPELYLERATRRFIKSIQ
ncbi:TetR/AcrR family transcriptional regulator [Cytophagaceae bacterium DM2B3-1]|uniref:TetR/AcrR family transcriptional regulator n=2 Tax=Xanthocytophaga TaxID=3078918 RepID=A0ABT7CW84_9BACT|nr:MULTISPECIES: TetR/AcrR family transcriptional regulator [Xanthocytophaga]MDJ1497195.1 TetR/AcrR family transcriptional regulator [Xanthocytophaga flavus]MDJ1500226.1 TetR/AcrR family transcriptional regulator [Xanthocytophaga agilis]